MIIKMKKYPVITVILILCYFCSFAQQYELELDWSDEFDGVEPPQPGNENLALNKPATTSSKFNHGQYGLLRAGNATDGNLNSRWGSNEENVEYTPEWLQVDLEKVETLNKIVVHWEAAFAREYNVEVSTTGQTGWTPVFSSSNGAQGAANIALNDVSARYIKVNCTRKISPWEGNFYGYSILELEAYGTVPTGTGLPKAIDFEIVQNNEAIAVRSATALQSVALYSTGGQLIARSGKDNKIAVSGLSKGVYILNVSDISGNRKSIKIIINNN
jgi:hypothetical protein